MGPSAAPTLLTEVSQLLSALAGFAWPAAALVIVLLFRQQIAELLPRIRGGELPGGIKFHLQVDDFRNQVAKTVVTGGSPATDAPGQPSRARDDRSTTTDTELAEVRSLASSDARLALIRLSSLLDRELDTLGKASGVAPARTPDRLLDSLSGAGKLSVSAVQSVRTFWQLRDAILGTNSAVRDADIVRVLDIGVTLLASIRATPRETAIVARAAIRLFADSEGREQRRDVVGVLLDVTSPGGLVTERRLVPSSRRAYYIVGRRVGWSWDSTRQWGPTWYKDTDSGAIRQAWESAVEFSGPLLDQVESDPALGTGQGT